MRSAYGSLPYEADLTGKASLIHVLD